SIVLTERLFKDYNTQASPYVGRVIADTHNALSVALRLTRAIIASVNERDWTISILVSANYKWNDPRLVWDPAEADGITEMMMKSDAIWQPDIYPCESAKIGNVLKEIIPSVTIRYDGTVSLEAYQMVNFI
ncbi:hypothetical protein PENTCL1PPCAC_20573, partial [Pristionchus entomophagus]